ncbi:MAG: hypothetical protein Q8P18_27890 [Pseudomonadota bacterium]|nr:hypothetical protein [Pseudomonadota bacterium]
MGRSIDDWLELAATADDEDQRAGHLAAAEALAESAWDWRRLLGQAKRHGVGDAAWREHVADRLLGAAIAEGEAGGVTDVARLRADRVDLGGAREALEAGYASFDPDGRSHAWTHLARAFAELLGDLEGARRCLDRSGAADLSSRCAVALARAELLDARPEAVAALAALTPAETHQAWTLANAWQTLDEPARTHAVLEAALADAAAVPDVLTVAHAWASHGRAAERDRALDVAESRAGTVADWLAVADTCQQLDAGDRLRAALTRAEALPLDDAARASLAAAWLWLGETARADALGPRGIRPDAFAPLVRELPGFDPDANVLFDDLRARITEASLRDLAGADYGHGYDKHLAALSDLVHTGRVPRPLPWEPKEVLALRRWSEGDTVDHVQRALCCALLCLDGDDGHNDPPILVESAVALGEPALTEAERLLAWLYASAGEDHDNDRFAALWGLALLCAARDPDDPRLDTLAARADEAIAEGASAEGICRYSVRKALWTELSARWFARGGITARWRALVAPTG